ncbi:MAG: anhydro-N-acetylmuramic acid kinase, partial [Candidatus Eremiobacteraeota bacterium]|nr:anhydro-N-acetylmuramic acid kinase [Candidatus Eremiobacteraeota bacterium]
MLAAGLMCGTSLDGIDVALAHIVPRRTSYLLEPVALQTVPLLAVLVENLRNALPPAQPPLAEIARLDADLGAAFGHAVSEVAAGRRLDYVASHGVTLYHDGDAKVTWQIGDPFAIRERAAATVLSDFRRGDCAAGGHGAPLVPYVDALLFASVERFRVALNLGGIANLTILCPRVERNAVTGWDVGPGNMLLDEFVRCKTS